MLNTPKHTHTRTQQTRTHAQSHTRTVTHNCTHEQSHTYTHEQSRTRTVAHTHAYTRTVAHIHTQSNVTVRRPISHNDQSHRLAYTHYMHRPTNSKLDSAMWCLNNCEWSYRNVGSNTMFLCIFWVLLPLLLNCFYITARAEFFSRFLLHLHQLPKAAIMDRLNPPYQPWSEVTAIEGTHLPRLRNTKSLTYTILYIFMAFPAGLA